MIILNSAPNNGAGVAAHLGHVEVVRLLLLAGASDP